MKLLFVTPRFPYPLLRGDQVVSYHRIRTLGQRHKITLLTFYEHPSELENIDYISPYCETIHTVRLTKLQSIFNIVKGVLNLQLPLQLSYYQSEEFQYKINSILTDNSFDLIHIFLIRVAPYFHHISTPKVLEIIDSMQLNLQRRIALEYLPKRWIFQEELRRIIQYEHNLHNFFDHMVVVSEKDRQFIPSKRVKVIPNGIDTRLFCPVGQPPLKPTLIFSGNMSYAPNCHAVKWFVKSCLPIIQQTIPEVSFLIAGANPSREVCSLGQTPGVTVTGFVKSMPTILRQANVAIAPMQSGSGIQNKILEAMASGLPVVTTTLGLGSLKATPGKEIMVADSPEDFAKTTITLLKDTELAGKVGHQAREFVVNKHSWKVAANQIEELYGHILSQKIEVDSLER
ncbi:glycosyltransferase [Nostoc sp. CENA67]|uniref:Glycosyltransferase n=1 Tax=Amazonocrinis nigriterrae CENA67 TaxID=2794033 RepID=A0A8J7HQN5_9NOST|nr:glycosyltransferase [Amazonocrinis nigriterrae]MBH8563677.1 glycosyltransferase [Amazonocrinis nigriterrae CENA67]